MSWSARKSTTPNCGMVGNAGVIGQRASRCASVRQSTGSLPAVPRGSQLTTSKRSLTPAKMSAADRRKSTPEPPGPPGLVKTVPAAFPLPVCGFLMTARAIVPAWGAS